MRQKPYSATYISSTKQDIPALFAAYNTRAQLLLKWQDSLACLVLVLQWQGCELKEFSSFHHLGENDKSSYEKWKSVDPEIFSPCQIMDVGQRSASAAELQPRISSQSSSSFIMIFYLPNNTTLCTFAWIRFRRAGQQGPIRTLTAALKRSIKTVAGCIFYHTNKNITNEKN